jgi:hypothetical protein
MAKEVTTPSYIALIGDIVHSRLLQNRAEVQRDLMDLMRWLNHTYETSIASSFIITTGDEFQALFSDPNPIADILWDLDDRFPWGRIRTGIGVGIITTELKSEAIGMDGPVWYEARAAIERAKDESSCGGVFSGFGADQDRILNGMAKLLHWHRSKQTDLQRLTFRLARRGMSQKEIASSRDTSKQSISALLARSGYTEYFEGEQAFRTAIRIFSENH